MATFTFRFHNHGWTDITVEAQSEEEAVIAAEDKYNNGEYSDEDTGFKNTDLENITDVESDDDEHEMPWAYGKHFD